MASFLLQKGPPNLAQQSAAAPRKSGFPIEVTSLEQSSATVEIRRTLLSITPVWFCRSRKVEVRHSAEWHTGARQFPDSLLNPPRESASYSLSLVGNTKQMDVIDRGGLKIVFLNQNRSRSLARSFLLDLHRGLAPQIFWTAKDHLRRTRHISQSCSALHVVRVTRDTDSLPVPTLRGRRGNAARSPNQNTSCHYDFFHTFDFLAVLSASTISDTRLSSVCVFCFRLDTDTPQPTSQQLFLK